MATEGGDGAEASRGTREAATKTVALPISAGEEGFAGQGDLEWEISDFKEEAAGRNVEF